jgi:hypothetical protein
VRASKRDLRLSALSMHRDDDLTFAPLFMLVLIKAAAMLGQPFPKCGTFHCTVPIDLNHVIRTFAIMRKFWNASVDLRQTIECPLMTQTGHAGRRRPRQLLGVKRTPQYNCAAAANDP